MLRETLRPYLTLIVIGVLLYGFILYVWPLMLPFFLALAVSILIDGPVSALERHRIPRSVAIVVILTAVLLIVSLVATVGVTALSVELAQLSRSLPGIWDGLVATSEQFRERLETLAQHIPPNVMEYVAQQRESLLEWLLASVSSVLGLVQQWALQGIPQGAITLMITGVATYLMSRDKQGILAFLARLVPEPWRPQAVKATGLFIGSAIGFVNALAILLSITTVITALGLRILGSPYAMVLGVLSGILDLIPVMGPGLIFVPWILYHLLVGEAAFGLWLGILYAILTVTRVLLEPRIIGSRIGVHPLTTLIALYVGLKIFGMAGFIIGPLFAIFIKSLVRVGLFALGGEEETQ